MKTITKSWKRIAIGLLMALVILPAVWYDRASAQGNEPADPFDEYVYEFIDNQNRNVLRVGNKAVKQQMKPGYTEVVITLKEGYKAKMYVKFRPDIEDAHFEALNKYRESLGLSKLKRDAKLDAHARQRAAEIAFVYEQNEQLTHTRPNGYTGAQITQSAGENILVNFGGADNDGAGQQAEEMLDMYKNSPGHNKNMTQDDAGFAEYAGVGVAEIDSMYDGLPAYFNTQSFGFTNDHFPEPNFTPYDQVEGRAPWIYGSGDWWNERPTPRTDSERYKNINMPTLTKEVQSVENLTEDEKAQILEAVKTANSSNQGFLRDVKSVVSFDNNTKKLVLKFSDRSTWTYTAPEIALTEKGMSQNVQVDPIFAGTHVIKIRLLPDQDDRTRTLFFPFKEGLEEDLSGRNLNWTREEDPEPDSRAWTYHIPDDYLMYAGKRIDIETTEPGKYGVTQVVIVKPLLPEKIKVQNPENLTSEEKQKLHTAILNKNKLPDGTDLLPNTNLDIADDGTATFTFVKEIDKNDSRPVETIPGTELVYSQNSYTVRFIANGGGGSMSEAPVDDGASYKLPACEFTAPSGKKFKAWLVDGAEKRVGESIIVQSDLNIEAVWEADTTTTKTQITKENFKVTDLETTYKKAEEQEPKFDERFTRDRDYIVSYAKKVESEGALGSNRKPLGAGTYTVTVTGKGNYTGVITKTFTIKKATQEAPTTVTASAGKLSGLTDKMQYRKQGATDWIAIQGTEVTGLAAGTYEVRIKGTANYEASESATVTVPPHTVAPAPTQITEENFKVKDLETTYKKAEEQEPKFDERFTRDTDYTVSYAKKVESEGALGSNGKPLGAGTYTVTVTGKGNYTGVITKTFTIKKATQEAPTTVTASAGKLSGLTDKMEYSKGDNGPWTACPDGELPGLAADTYHVRFKATDNYLAGKELTVEVPASPGNEDPSQPGTQDPNEPGTEEPGTGGTTPSNPSTPSTPSIPSIPSVPSVTTPSKPVTKIPEQKGTNYGYAVAPAGSVDSTTRVRITEKANGKRDVILVDGNGNQVYSDELMLVTIPAPKGLKGSYRVKVDGVYTTFELSEDGKYVTMPMVFSRDGKMSDKVTLGKDGVLVQGSKKALPGMYKLSVTNRGNGRYSVNLLDQNGKQTRSNGPVMVSIPAPQGVKDVYRVNVDGKWTTFEIKDGIVRFAMVF